MNEQPSLFDTRRAAAEAISPRAGTLRAIIAQAILSSGEGGLTADEAAERLRLSPFTVRPRVTELGQSGAIRDSGRRRRNRSGNKAIVWVSP